MPKNRLVNYLQLNEGLKQFLARSGPSTAKEICNHLQISQPTLSRLLSDAKAPILRAGRGSRTQYALNDFLPTGQSEIPVFTISENATALQVATLYAVRPGGYYLASKSESISSRFYVDLPYLFEDLRPSGFLGRLIPRIYKGLLLPENIQNWNDKHCLLYLTNYGWDLSGNYILERS